MACTTAQPAAVLVVDDLKINRVLLGRILTKLGFDVIEAEHGLQAMELFQQELCRCVFVFLDLVMPYKDGYSTAKEIRQMEQQSKQKRTPIVAYTAEQHDRVLGGGETVLTACQRSGMDDYLGKPVTLERVRQLVQQHLPMYPLQQGPSAVTSNPLLANPNSQALQEQARSVLSAASADNVRSFVPPCQPANGQRYNAAASLGLPQGRTSLGSPCSSGSKQSPDFARRSDTFCTTSLRLPPRQMSCDIHRSQLQGLQARHTMAADSRFRVSLDESWAVSNSGSRRGSSEEQGDQRSPAVQSGGLQLWNI